MPVLLRRLADFWIYPYDDGARRPGGPYYWDVSEDEMEEEDVELVMKDLAINTRIEAVL